MFIFLFSFCSKKESLYPRLIVQNNNRVVQVNTKTMLHVSLDSDDYFFVRNFDSAIKVGERDFKEEEKHLKKFKWDTVFPKYDFKIIIDTSYTIAAKGFEYKNLGFTEDGRMDYAKVFALLKDYVECYPLLIYNNGNKTSYSHNIRLIQEAKDQDGKWKPIEYFANYPSCIPNPFCNVHQPQKYSALSIIKYHGDFKTKLRVKVKIGEYIYYSNEIVGSINHSQFDKTIAVKMIKTWKPNWNDDFINEYLPFVFLKEANK